MKKLVYIFLFFGIITISITSCKDDTEQFVGAYTVTEDIIETIGSKTNSYTMNGTMSISKVSRNKVKVSGWIDTEAETYNNTITFRSNKWDDDEYDVVFSYGLGVLDGNTLTFGVLASGKVKGTSN